MSGQAQESMGRQMNTTLSSATLDSAGSVSVVITTYKDNDEDENEVPGEKAPHKIRRRRSGETARMSA